MSGSSICLSLTKFHLGNSLIVMVNHHEHFTNMTHGNCASRLYGWVFSLAHSWQFGLLIPIMKFNVGQAEYDDIVPRWCAMKCQLGPTIQTISFDIMCCYCCDSLLWCCFQIISSHNHRLIIWWPYISKSILHLMTSLVLCSTSIPSWPCQRAPARPWPRPF